MTIGRAVLEQFGKKDATRELFILEKILKGLISLSSISTDILVKIGVVLKTVTMFYAKIIDLIGLSAIP